MEEQKSVHELCGSLLNGWAADGNFSSAGMEGALPKFSARLAQSAEEFTFDSFFHNTEVAGWSWRTVEFTDVFAGAFYLYLPEQWADIRIHKNAANVLEGRTIRQSLFILDKVNWAKSLPIFLSDTSIEAFAYYPLLPPLYHQWLVCTRDNNAPNIDWLYAIYGAGDWVFISKSDASDVNTLNMQITSLLNSNPWYGWIEQAREKAGT